MPNGTVVVTLVLFYVIGYLLLVIPEEGGLLLPRGCDLETLVEGNGYWLEVFYDGILLFVYYTTGLLEEVLGANIFFCELGALLYKGILDETLLTIPFPTSSSSNSSKFIFSSKNLSFSSFSF